MNGKSIFKVTSMFYEYSGSDGYLWTSTCERKRASNGHVSAARTGDTTADIGLAYGAMEMLAHRVAGDHHQITFSIGQRHVQVTLVQGELAKLVDLLNHHLRHCDECDAGECSPTGHKIG